MKKSFNIIIGTIIFLLVGLRLTFLINAPLIGDEKEFLLVANSISFNPVQFNLPLEHPLIHHPLLSVYTLKVGISIFSETKLGIRFFSLVSGLMTILLLFGFTKRTLGRPYALTAVILLGLNRFHIGISGLGVDDALLLFLSSLSIFLFWRALTNQRACYIAIAGVSAGLAYLTKESAILLLGCYVIYLILTPKYRDWFKQSKFYILLCSFLCTISVYIIWMLKHGTSQRLIQDKLWSNLGIGPSGLGFFLIELTRYIKNIDFHALVSWEYPTMPWIMGLLLLVCSIITYFKYKTEIVRFMSLILGLFVLFTGILKQAEFYWAEISLIPAVYLSSISLVSAINKSVLLKKLAFVFCLVLSLTNFVFTLSAKQALPPDRFANKVDYDTDLIEWLYLNGEVERGIAEAKQAQIICPNEVRIKNLLKLLESK
ncbi:glycosyltransferase family 39 protein [Candidatus Omnitrophota bacterium]